MDSLHVKEWPPAGSARAGVLLVHGYADHCGRYETLATRLAAAGIRVFAYDQRGHGQSPGRRGFIADFDLLVADLGTQVDTALSVCGGAPLFLLGHSMGGLVSVRYLATAPRGLAGSVLSSPLLAIPEHVPRWKIRAAGILGTVAPWLPVDRVEAGGMSRIPAEVARYADDPLVYHGPVHARTGAQIADAIARAQASFSAVRLPVLVIHGTADRVAPIAGSRMLFDGAGSNEKACHWEEGGYHELLHDLSRTRMEDLIVRWIDARLAAR